MILLDTHVWIWLNRRDDALPKRLVKEIEGGEPFGVSVISLWEAMMLIERGRVAVPHSPESAVRSWIVNPLQVLPMDIEISILARTLAFRHDDPADRFIAATAFHAGARLATADKNLLALPWLSHF